MKFNSIVLTGLLTTSATVGAKDSPISFHVDELNNSFHMTCKITVGEGRKVPNILVDACENKGEKFLKKKLKENVLLVNYKVGQNVFKVDFFKNINSYNTLTMNRKISFKKQS